LRYFVILVYIFEFNQAAFKILFSLIKLKFKSTMAKEFDNNIIKGFFGEKPWDH